MIPISYRHKQRLLRITLSSGYIGAHRIHLPLNGRPGGKKGMS